MKKLKNALRMMLYAVISTILALIFLLILNYFSFYVHEFGHASAATLSIMTRHESSITINFTYIPYLNYFKVPQQTISKLPKIMSIYGVLFTMVFYALIFISLIFIISKIKSLRENKRIEFCIATFLILLIFRDVILNLFCGTDGFNLYCNQNLISMLNYLFLLLLLLTLGWFFMEILYLKKFRREK